MSMPSHKRYQACVGTSVKHTWHEFDEAPRHWLRSTKDFDVSVNTPVALISMRRVEDVYKGGDNKPVRRTREERLPGSGITLLVTEGSRVKRLVNGTFFIAHVIVMEGRRPVRLVQLSFTPTGEAHLTNYSSRGRAQIVRLPSGKLIVTS